MSILSNLEPNRVFYYFEEICKIPHGSYNTKAISDYCVSVAKGFQLDVKQDQWNNVIIRKPGSKGCENAPVIMLQGHLDMVCEKESHVIHDFETEGLNLLVEDGYVTADGTTLGGDDGIAVAICLAILEDNTLVHPPLEVVFTTEEEVGMDGALGLDTSDLKASYLLNLDSEEEGVLTVGCAGGSTMEINLPYVTEEMTGVPYELKISGLVGGHSGVEIQKGRANSNKLMVQLLLGLSDALPYYLISVNGGTKHNAIPRETTAQIVFGSEDAISDAMAVIKQYQSLFTEAYQDSDAGIEIDLQPCGVEYKVKNGHVTVIKEDDKRRFLHLLLELPDGVQAMSQTVAGLPETSLNLGVLKTYSEENRIYLEASNRSSNKAGLALLEKKLQVIAQANDCSCKKQSEYPGWSYRRDSKLREVMVDIYRNMYQKDMKIEIIHAGLECGILASGMPDLDIVSTGPDILDIHTPQERMSIVSVQRTYTFVLRVLEELSKY